MTIVFNFNLTKKKVHHKFEVALNFRKEIPLKCFLSPLEDSQSPLGIVHFIREIPLKFIYFENTEESSRFILTKTFFIVGFIFIFDF